MQIINVTQSTPEWLELRKLKLTASHAQAIASQGKGLDTYCLDVVAGFLSKGIFNHYTNNDMERGRELEDDARVLYTLQTGNKVEQIGFVIQNEFVGCSPDGFVNNNGLVEIKCKNDKNHLQQMIEGINGIETSYIWQMQMQMLVCERDWCDFVCYNPNFEKSLLIYRIEKDLKAQEKLKTGIEMGIAKIKEMLEKVKNGKN